MKTPIRPLRLLACLPWAALSAGHALVGAEPATPPRIDRLDPALDAILASDSPVEVLGTGYRWAEGPVWSAGEGALYFSDLRSNVVHRWSADRGVEVFLQNSGIAGPVDPARTMLGANGLEIDPAGRLLLCQHGNRQVIRLESDGRRTTLADRHQGRRFNSPNDLARHVSGDLYFTDPCFGLKDLEKDPSREIDITGVYRIPAQGGPVELVAGELMPNGIAFAPDHTTVYLTDQKRLMVCERQPDGSLGPRREFFALPEEGDFDGLAVDQRGTVFACNWRGAVYLLSPEGRHLGTIRPGRNTANCVVGGPTGRDLFITAGNALLRVKLRAWLGQGDGSGNVWTDAWMGAINVTGMPWVFVYALNQWVFLPEDHVSGAGAWGYINR